MYKLNIILLVIFTNYSKYSSFTSVEAFQPQHLSPTTATTQNVRLYLSESRPRRQSLASIFKCYSRSSLILSSITLRAVPTKKSSANSSPKQHRNFPTRGYSRRNQERGYKNDGLWVIISDISGESDRNDSDDRHMDNRMWAKLAFERITSNFDKSNETINSISSYESVINILFREHRWRDAWFFFNEILDRQDIKNEWVPPAPVLNTYHIMLDILQLVRASNEAVKLVDSMNSKYAESEFSNSDCIKPSTKTFNLAITACRRAGDWRKSIDLLTCMSEGRYTGVNPDVHSYNEVLISCAKNKKITKVAEVFAKMQSQGIIQPDLVTYNTVISAYVKVGKSKEALSLFDKMKFIPGIQPDVVTYTCAMRAYMKSGYAAKALILFEMMQDKKINLDAFAYASAIDACAKMSKWKKALDFLDEMRMKGIEPNAVVYSTAINACGNGGQWERALELLHQMKEKKIRINVFTYNAAIGALAKSSRRNHLRSSSGLDEEELWKKALILVEEIKKQGLNPDTFTYSSAIDVCGNGGRWQEALSLMNQMKASNDAKTRPNKVAYTAAITACSRVGRWEDARNLFHDMKNTGITPDLIAYNALLSSFLHGNKPDLAYEVWEEVCANKNITPDIITLTNVIGALDRTNQDRKLMDNVFLKAVKLRLVMKEHEYSLDTTWEVDLSGMSTSLARAACRYIAERACKAVLEGHDDVQDLTLITGCRGPYQELMTERKQHQNRKDSKGGIREYIQESLRDDFEPPLLTVVPDDELGTVVVKMNVMRRWVNARKLS